MKKLEWGHLCIGILLALGVVACQTTKQAKSPAVLSPAAASSIATESQGFSPKAEAGRNTIDFALTIGNPEKLKAWKVEIQSETGGQKTLSGTGSSIPTDVTWDGKNDSGNPAPEGTYTAALSIDYVDTFSSSQAVSSKFILDVSAPTGNLVVSPANPIPSGNGFVSPASIKVDVSSKTAKIDSWSVDILDSDGRVFQSYSNKWPQNSASWDGLSSGGIQASALTTYQAIATVRDEFGNVGKLNAAIKVADIPSTTGATSIESRYEGFSPNGESSVKTMDFSTQISQRDALKTWNIAIVHGDRGEQRRYSGDGHDIPSSLSWDGMTNGGELAPEGRYSAILKVDYGTAYKPQTVRSRTFILDLTPPSGAIVPNPSSLTPDGKGGLKPITITIFANSQVARLDSWELNVFALDGRGVITVQGRFPNNTYEWNGTLPNGASIDSSVPYKLSAKVSDIFGNTAVIRGSLARAAAAGPAAAAAAPETTFVTISPKSAGFSPNRDNTFDSMEFELSYGQPQAVKSWKVEIAKADKVVMTYTGDSASLPASLSWDGKQSDGLPASEDFYTASLSVDFGGVFKPAMMRSKPFTLDLTPPFGSIVLSQPLFSPLESSPTIGISLDASSNVAKLESWSMKIYDPAGNLFKSFDGRWPSNKVAWDGKGLDGVLVESAEDYRIAATIRDEFGLSSEIKSVIPVDILVEKTAAGYRILSSRIFFKAFTADYIDVAPDLSSQNLYRLDQLAAKLKKFPGYRIKAIGHAVMINWDNPARGKIEQEQILLPLSASRAEAIKKAMVERGFDPEMIATQGVGATDQLVPDSDTVNRWRNRRVAFYLEKP